MLLTSHQLILPAITAGFSWSDEFQLLAYCRQHDTVSSAHTAPSSRRSSPGSPILTALRLNFRQTVLPDKEEECREEEAVCY
jgi:hypothetical protein